MPRRRVVSDWEAIVTGHSPDLPKRTARALALASLGMAVARSGLLNTLLIALATLTGSAFNALRQRLRNFYKDEQFSPCACSAPLLRWATAGVTDRRLAVALDPTHLGNRFTVLTASVLFRGGAVPVAWAVLRADQRGSWNDHWARLLRLLRAELGDGRTVLVLTDRGLESKALFEAIVGVGFHPLMRVKANGHFRPEGRPRGQAMGRLASVVGARWSGRGVAWPGSSKLECTLLACRGAGHKDAWLLLTDLSPGSADAGWYAMRAWIESGFRDLKSDGWDLERGRMTDPDRVGRQWAVAAVALWAAEAGQEVERLRLPSARAHQGRAKPPVSSRFAPGLAWLVQQIVRARLRELKPLRPFPWPAVGPGVGDPNRPVEAAA